MPVELTQVSYHAVMRYVQRFIRHEPRDLVFVDTDFAPLLDLNNREQAEALCAAEGIGIDEVRMAILTPTVRLALSMGARRVLSGTMEVIIIPAVPRAVIATVQPRYRRSHAIRLLAGRRQHQGLEPEDWA